MIGQTRANVERFDKYAKELQSSDDLIDSAKVELMEANELLHTRIASIAAGADERKSLYVNYSFFGIACCSSTVA